MFDGIEDYNFDGTPKKDYGCLIIFGLSVLIFLFGVLLGWLI